MGPMNLHFDIRDIFRAPRLALSGKKIWIFILGNIVGYVSYWILTYVAFAIAGINFSQSWSDYGLYPCLFGNEASCFLRVKRSSCAAAIISPLTNNDAALSW